MSEPNKSRKKQRKRSAVEARERFKVSRPGLPQINFRPFLYAAFGLILGIILYMRCRFGGAKGTDFVFFVLLTAFSLKPLSLRRIGVIFLCLAVFAGLGAGLMHIKCASYTAGMPAGDYEVSGTVVSFSADGETSALILSDVAFDGVFADGKLSVVLPAENVRTGDRLNFRASVSRCDLPIGGNSYEENLFVKDIRYFATVGEEGFAVTGRGNALLRLNAAVYNVLHANLSATQADTAYALLTGNAGSLDEGFATAVREGGVAHIFAVSGLHIGILYAAVSFVCKKLKKFRVIPAVSAAILYAAFCGFSVSSVRAVIMCAALGVQNVFGRKYDFLNAIAFSACFVLLLRPAEWLSAGFRLSFGACAGLALYSRPLGRIFRRLPRMLSGYLSANLSVQVFTFPIMFETFGYVSLWGTLLNLLLIPALPVMFLGLFLATGLSLLIPPAAAVFLSVPNGMITLFLWIFSFDFSLVLAGFSLGAGGALWLIGAVLLSERVRIGERAKVHLTVFLSVLFAATLVLNNAVFTGCKLISAKGVVLVETRSERILVADGSLGVKSCKNFLMRNYGGTLDAVVVLGGDDGLQNALYLPCKEVRASVETATGFEETIVLYERQFTYGALQFCFEGENKLTLVTEGRTVEIDFTGNGSLGADLFLNGENAGVYYLKCGAVYGTN